MELANLPSPLRSLDLLKEQYGLASLHIKEDGYSSSPFGGNKVRKLEFLLAAAEQRGSKSVITFGYQGSNHCVATAALCQSIGIRVYCQLLTQVHHPYVDQNLARCKEFGADIEVYPSKNALKIGTAKRLVKEFCKGRKPMMIPPGGSEPLGVLGFINAAMELADQYGSRFMSPPDRIYCAMSSAGTAVGLQLGIDFLEWPTLLVPVSVYEEADVAENSFSKLMKESCKFLQKYDIEIKPRNSPKFRHEFRGKGYAEATNEGVEALKVAEDNGFKLDITYTAKAFGCLLKDASSQAIKGQSVLFWNTLHQE